MKIVTELFRIFVLIQNKKDWPINYTTVFFRLKTKKAEMSVSKNAKMKTIADGISPNIDSSKLT